MKTNTKTIALFVTLSALTLSPVFGAPKKMGSSESKRPASKPSTSTLAAPSPATAVAKEKAPPQQAASRDLVGELTPTQKSKMLTLLNEGTASDLSDIKGVSKTRAAAIEKARPFENIDEVILVNGIGKATLAEIVNHARSLTTTRKKSPPASSAPKKGKEKAKS